MTNAIFMALALFAWPAWGSADCLDIPTPNVPRALRQALAHGLATDAGFAVAPHAPDGLQLGQSTSTLVCFDGLTIAQIGGFLSPASMQARYDAWLAAWQAAANAERLRQQAFEQEVGTNDLCMAELADLDARIDQAVNGITDLASAKQVLRVSLKKVARCLRATRGLEP